MNLGIPYMGSKRKLAGDILKFIHARHDNITDFYDLFGGGGSVSFTAIKYWPRMRVHYNELNAHIFALVEYLQTHRELEPKFYEWVTREEFFRQCARGDADWYSGFVMSYWSFGNKQSSYIYGSDIEELKRLAHQFVVFGCLESMAALGVDIPELLNIKDVQKRRIVFCDYIGKTAMGRFDIQNLERFVQLERIQNLQNLQNTNLSYKQVQITGSNPVIYCDIPYKGTGEYSGVGLDYEAFYQWAADCPHPVYISEYAAPFQEVAAFTHRSSLSATNNKKKTIEKIFWNGKGNPNKTNLFDL
jgi:site-specific DNA-adenine methylase